ncbi:MAG: TetR/AcrR family transcriptional regulator [Acidobacteria bacterium]|nr:TetR/AcrR family transcriptional regulator [Acidobacteriota bacterium]
MPETSRKRISQATQELFLKEGLEGVSMRKVAKIAGVSAAAIYRHYENKEDLLREIIDEGLQILETYLQPALDEPTPFERLNRLADRFLDFAIEQPKYFEFAFMIPNRSISDVRTELAEKNWVTFNLALEQIAACMETGIFKKDDPLGTAITVWAGVYGLVALHRMHRFGPDDQLFRQIYRASVDRMLDGLKP